jgi:Outer membrane protein
MHRTRIRSFLTAGTLALAALPAAAQSAPKIKPGLWEMRVEQEKNGQKVSNPSERMQEHMKTMTPERRKQFEEMMKQRGIDTTGSGAIRICYTQKMLDHGNFSDQGGCKTNFSEHSAGSWKWHSVCPQMNYEGEGEARFSDPENFIVKSSGVTTNGGNTVKTSSTRTGKWLSANCGAVKPMEPTP